MPLPDEPPRSEGVLVGTLSRVILFFAAAASVAIFVAVDGRSHSVSDTFYGVVVPEALVLAAAALALVILRVRSRGLR